MNSGSGWRWMWPRASIVGCYIGDPPWHLGCGILELLTCGVSLLVPSSKRDFWVSYPVALPSKRHRAVGKETGLTSYIERFNYTLRQRVSRLVRKTLSNSCEIGKSHRCDLEFHSSLQCLSPYQLILSSLGVPILSHL